MAIIKCPECGAMISSKAKQCPKCGYDMVQDNQNDLIQDEQFNYEENEPIEENIEKDTEKDDKNVNDESSGFLNFLSFLCPLLGLILFCFLKGSNKPHKANKCLEWALIGILTLVVFNLNYSY